MSQLHRLLTIIYVFSKHRLDDFIPIYRLPWYYRLALAVAPWRLNPLPKRTPRAKRLRLALIRLGPIFIKFGQILSTRRDLLPDDIAQELAKLQDKVPPFDNQEAVTLIEQALGKPINKVFSEFEHKPLASASIAQVYAANLQLDQGGVNQDREVVVKVIRPGIEKTIQRDIKLMLLAAQLVEKYSSDGERLHPVDVVKDYEHTIFGELDLLSEAGNATQLKRNFKDSPLLYVPEVYWEYCRPNVMVMERIYGTPIGDIDALKARGTNMKVLAERGVEIFFRQVFRDSFFHADMHPGNIFVANNDPENPQYIAIDCGIVGSLSPVDQDYLARNLLAFFNQDYHEVARLHVESGWVRGDTRVHEFERAIRTVCEPIFEKPLEEISFGNLLMQLFQTARRFNMEVQPQLVLLQKTLLNIEGLGRQLYPQLDLWTTAKPYMVEWMNQKVGPDYFWQELKRQFPVWVQHAPHMPELIRETLQHLNYYPETSEKLQQQVQSLSRQIDRQSSKQKNRVLGALIAVVGLVGLATPSLWPEYISIGLIGAGVFWLAIKD